MVNPNVQPAVTYPSPNEWPVTYRVITGISRDSKATVTAVNHGFTNDNDKNQTQVDFTHVKGMFQINGLFGYITDVLNADQFIVGIDTTNFYNYTSGGYVNILKDGLPYDPLTNTFA